MTIMGNADMKPTRRPLLLTLRRGCIAAAALAGLCIAPMSLAASNSLVGVDYSPLSGNRVQINLRLQNAAPAPQTFSIQDPARIAVDLPDTDNQLVEKGINIGVGVVESLTTAEAGGRTRVVIKLAQPTPYDVKSVDNMVQIVLNAGAATSAGRVTFDGRQTGGNAVLGVDFQRGSDGSGRILVKLSNPQIPVDIREEGGKIIADFLSSDVDQKLERRLDVTDFATPVNTVDVRQTGNRVRMTITPSVEFEQVAYQAGDVFTVEVKPVVQEPEALRARAEKEYKGERLSLNFQDIAVRSVLQLIADFTGLNLVVSDSVSGNITLRLQDVPWDQALDIILRTKGLDKRQQGNVLLIAPATEIAAREKLELEAQQQIEVLAPLRSEFLQINYAKAADIAQLISSKETGIMSERGRVTIDSRTNTLIVQDTDRNISDIRALVARLDIAVRQVLIESRIVIATDDFSRALGVRFGYSRSGEVSGNTRGVIGGTLPGQTNFGGTTGFETPAGSGREGLLVDLPATDAAGAIGLAIGRIGSHLLQLELSAMEAEGRGDIVSSPRVITANQKAATIKQGVEIPYQEAASSGATSISFKEAVLGLTVTPQITPDDRVLLDLEVSKDSIGQPTAAGPAINTQSVQTQVLVNNGETVVLGGVFERTNVNAVTRVPFFGDLPLIGALFRNSDKIDNRSELLIFVTPKILAESLSASN